MVVIIPELMKVAEDIAKESPCVRRKYGVVIADGEITWSMGNNTRVGRCCEGSICVRDSLQASHGQSIEIGAEIHAEATALLHHGVLKYGKQFYLAGFDSKGKQIKGKACRPCHYCCMLMIYSGFDNYIIKDENDELVFISTWETMEEHEATYGYQII